MKVDWPAPNPPNINSGFSCAAPAVGDQDNPPPMEPLGRPVCFDCRNPAVNCTCKLSSGRELLVQLVYRSEPADRNEGLNLWATYLERHPATHNVDAKRFITDFKKHGFFQALDQVQLHNCKDSCS